MLKTYVYLPVHLNQQISGLSRQRKSSKAEVIRRALQAGLSLIGNDPRSSRAVLQRLLHLSQQAKLRGPKDASLKMDEYLWFRSR